MIEIKCDNCERPFEVDPKTAPDKVSCPNCGDVNRVPSPDPAAPPPKQQGAVKQEGHEGKGLPPDSGPEQEICVVHPAMFRAHPFRYALLVAVLIGGVALAIAASTSQRLWSGLMWVGVVMGVAAVIWWVAWYVSAHLWVKLRISNKRTVRREGIIRRHTSEVLHDHVRNVEIKQSFLQRVFKVGYIGISSAGQDDIEIQVHDIPKPYEIKKLIDEYRGM